MKRKNHIPLINLARTADLINTINGGMSQASVSLKKSENEWIAQIRVPGVSMENLRIEVRDRYLFVFQNMVMKGEDTIIVPYLITMLELSNKVDSDAIIAEYENGRLIVTLPLNEPSSGHQRRIEIIRR